MTWPYTCGLSMMPCRALHTSDKATGWHLYFSNSLENMSSGRRSKRENTRISEEPFPMMLLTRTMVYVNPELKRWRRSEEHTSELQSRENLVCRLLLEKK